MGCHFQGGRANCPCSQRIEKIFPFHFYYPNRGHELCKKGHYPKSKEVVLSVCRKNKEVSIMVWLSMESYISFYNVC